MCGICGILATSDNFTCDEATVTAMRDTMPHRGPDDAGSWADPRHRVALGHRRLSIVDLSPAGHNPMPNEDGTVWITYNGEVYNHAPLRDGARGEGPRLPLADATPRRSSTSTRRRGQRCVERLEGMFAFAIWDSRRRELFLARDRLGDQAALLRRSCPAGSSSARRSRRCSRTRDHARTSTRRRSTTT